MEFFQIPKEPLYFHKINLPLRFKLMRFSKSIMLIAGSHQYSMRALYHHRGRSMLRPSKPPVGSDLLMHQSEKNGAHTVHGTTSITCAAPGPLFDQHNKTTNDSKLTSLMTGQSGMRDTFTHNLYIICVRRVVSANLK